MDRKSDFAEKVIQVVSSLKRGETITYKEVAKQAGKERAARAVGNILKSYYLGCVAKKKRTLPCYRVVRSDKKIGGYVKGEREKRRLLRKEGVVF